jgi:hypothetical protein
MRSGLQADFTHSNVSRCPLQQLREQRSHRRPMRLHRQLYLMGANLKIVELPGPSELGPGLPRRRIICSPPQGVILQSEEYE